MRKLLAILGLSLLSLVFAHQEIKVGDQYVMYCGNQNEPYYTGMFGGLELFIETPDGKPVTGAEKSLTIELMTPTGASVQYSDQAEDPSKSFRAAFGEEGKYVTRWILMSPGKYTVHITGFLGETPVDALCDSEIWDIKDKSAIEVR